jgi:iron-sulfur cluster assembly protein
MPAPVISISDNAAEKIKHLLASRAKPTAGIRVAIKTKGCSGLSYTIEYADEVQRFDEVVEEKGVKVLVDPKAIMFLIGSVMEYEEDKFKSGFVFRNPNEKGRCGCGESFHV